MANDVFANGREISCKAADGKSIAAFPDVCMTPPQTPATPPGVPVPYPNTGMAKDTTSGSKNVKISKKEVMLKNKSYYKKSSGDEAGNAPKKGVITSKIKGKVYFSSWSIDVKVEGENAVRHLDITTHNHASQTGQTPTFPNTDSQAPSGGDEKCKLTTYDPNDCPEGQTPHHLVPDSLFNKKGRPSSRVPGVDGLTYANGMCICLEGQDKSATVSDDKIRDMGLNPGDIPIGNDGVRRLNKKFLESTRQSSGRVSSMFPNWSGCSPFSLTRGEHGLFHEQFDNIVQAIGGSKPPPCTNTATFSEQRDTAASLCARRFGCDEGKIRDQLDEHYSQFDVNENTVLRSSDRSKSQPVNSNWLGNVPNNPCARG